MIELTHADTTKKDPRITLMVDKIAYFQPNGNGAFVRMLDDLYFYVEESYETVQMLATEARQHLWPKDQL